MYYKGTIVPPKIDDSREDSCKNAYCIGVDCFECIHFPSEKVAQILHEYKHDEYRKEYKDEWF